MAIFQAFAIGLFFIFISLATKTHFRSDKFPAGMIAISVLSIAGVANSLFQIIQEQRSEFWPIALIGAAYVLFIWAILATRKHELGLAFDDTKTPKRLAMSGPYRIIRHPFYVSYALYWVGVAAISDNAVGYFITTSLAFFYGFAARREEKLIVNSFNGVDYAEYQKRTIF